MCLFIVTQVTPKLALTAGKCSDWNLTETLLALDTLMQCYQDWVTNNVTNPS